MARETRLLCWVSVGNCKSPLHKGGQRKHVAITKPCVPTMGMHMCH